MLPVEDYLTVAEGLAADIATGRLAVGARLAPQRQFARRLHLAPSTVARAYRELARRGLVVGEVGRGTFVRSASPAADRTGDRAGDGPIADVPGGGPAGWVDLEQNHGLLPGQATLMQPVLQDLIGTRLDETLRPVGPRGIPSAIDALRGLVSRPGWSPPADGVLTTGSGRQAVAAALRATTGPGGRIATEPTTYPVVRQIGRALGVDVVPLEVDEHGATPDGLEAAVRTQAVGAVYLQPTLHNPTTTTMPADRRAAVAEVLERLGLWAVEDAVYGFLRDDPPLAAYAPDRVLHVDSLTKRLSPGITAGVVVAPAERAPAVASAVRAGGWGPARLSLAALAAWIHDGTVHTVQTAKRADATERQRVVSAVLAGFDVRTDPAAYHCWWSLPSPWRADTFVAAAAREGIACTPAATFTVGTHAPQAVRLALASPTLDELTAALGTLAGIARRADDGVE